MMAFLLVALSTTTVRGTANASDLPAPRIEAAMPDATLYLELVVNGVATGRIVSVAYRDAHYFIEARELLAISVRTTAKPDEQVAVDLLPDVRVAYDGHAQRLDISVPPAWLPQQRIGRTRLFDRTPAATSFGLLLNYDLYASAPTDAAGAVSAWTEQRIFDRWGAISNTGLYRHTLGDNARGSGSQYLRYDTSWMFSDENRMITYTAGDLTTGALSWNSAVRLGGVSIARNFHVRPDIITYPLPAFAGQTAVPTAVDLFINGSQALSARVAPGPFTIDDVPFISGAGTATVVTTDALGRQVSTAVSFYVADTLLQKGLYDYSVSAGALRRQFGVHSFSYGGPAATGIVRYGLSNTLTLEAHGEAGPHTAGGGLGGGMKVGRFGVLNLSAALSDGARTGQQYAAGYGYIGRRFSLNVQRLQRTAGFTDLSAGDADTGSLALTRRIDQATGAIGLGRGGGTLGAGYFDILDANASHTRLANISYSRSFLKHSSLYLSANTDLGRKRGLTAQAQILVPFGRQGSTSLVVARDGEHDSSARVQYNRTLPTEGGLGWNVGYANGGDEYRQADLSWRNAYTQMTGGLYGAPHSYTRWGELSGAAVVMDGGIFPANRINDSFVLVDTDGHKDVPVLFENQPVGKTDRGGHLLVPWVASYYAAKYQIDPLNLPDDVTVPVVEQRIAVRQRSGAVVRFPLESVVAAIVFLVDAQGLPLPLGLPVVHEETGQTRIVGWDGLVYLEDLDEDNHLRVTLPDGAQCAVSFPLATPRHGIARIGPLPCR
jgi:outer membrane usher protein